jgi:hypothetical protein
MGEKKMNDNKPVTKENIEAINNEELFYNMLKVKRAGNKGVFLVIGFRYGKEELRHRGMAEDVAKYLNGYFGLR